MTRIPAVATVLSLFFLFPGPLRAQDAPARELPAPVRLFIDRMYNPQREGLKDLSATLDTPLTRGNKVLKHIRIVVYVKAPDRHCLDIQGLPDDTRKVLLQQLQPLSTLTKYLFCLGAIVERVLGNSELAVSTEDGLQRIEARPRSAELKREFRSLLLWVDDGGRPVRIDQDTPDLGNISVRVETEERDGKTFLAVLRASGMKGLKGDLVGRITYEKTGALWLPASISLSKGGAGKAAGDGKPAEEAFHLKDYRVNEGVDDEVFRKIELLAAAERRAKAKSDLEALRTALDLYRVKTRAYPESLAELAVPFDDHPPLLASDPPKDPWGRDYQYRRTETGFVLRCLGADGKEGGEGEDTDLE